MIRDDMVITHVKYRDTSSNANPRYWVTFSDNTTTSTEADGSVGYGITNSEFRGVPLRVEFNRKGNVTHIQTMDGRFQA